MIQLHSLILNPKSRPAIHTQEVQNGVLLEEKLWIVRLEPVNAGEAHRFSVYVDTTDKERTKKADVQLMRSSLEYLSSFDGFKKALEGYLEKEN